MTISTDGEGSAAAGGEDEDIMVGLVAVVAAREAGGVGSGDVLVGCDVGEIRDGDEVDRNDSEVSKLGMGDDDEEAEEEEEKKFEVLLTYTSRPSDCGPVAPQQQRQWW
jgi:hypothetical protein